MSNDDYIKRSDALEIIMEWCPDDDGSVGKVGDLREMLDEIESIPAADVEPKRKTGKWIDLDDHLLCSSCGASHTEPDKNYCPNCGAKINGELPKEEIND